MRFIIACAKMICTEISDQLIILRFIIACAKMICTEISDQLWLSNKNLHPDYLDFSEFLRYAEFHQRALLNEVIIESLSDDEWFDYKDRYFVDYRD